MCIRDSGKATMEAVKAFQAKAGISVDGIAGAATQRALVRAGQSPIVAPKHERDSTDDERKMDKMIARSSTVLGSGGAVSLLSALGGRSQEILVGGVVLGVLVVGLLWFLRKKS